MQTEKVFHPDGGDPGFRHVALISGGFFLFVQLVFLEELPARLVFTVFFAGFLLAGLWLSNRSRRTWPQKIVMNREGIRYGDLQARHGVDWVPWNEIDRLDLFYNEHNTAPFLRIGLRSGTFRARLRQPLLNHLSMGLDVNIPVAVGVAPEVVLQTARRFWAEAGQGRARTQDGESPE